VDREHNFNRPLAIQLDVRRQDKLRLSLLQWIVLM
jgi:hypothetical protein